LTEKGRRHFLVMGFAVESQQEKKKTSQEHRKEETLPTNGGIRTGTNKSARQQKGPAPSGGPPVRRSSQATTARKIRKRGKIRGSIERVGKNYRKAGRQADFSLHL